MTDQTLQEAGPLLGRLLTIQAREAELVQFPALNELADAVVSVAQELGECLLWPVGPAAERVAGVVTVRSRGGVDVAAWNAPVAGRRLLLLALVAASPLGLQTVADQLRRRGAAEVHACAIDIAGAEASSFDSFHGIVQSSARRQLSVVGDAA